MVRSDTYFTSLVVLKSFYNVVNFIFNKLKHFYSNSICKFKTFFIVSLKAFENILPILVKL